MPQSPNLSRLRSCDQEWDRMSVCGDRRICQLCDREIHDFRGKSAWEIALVHARSETKVCGIYDAEVGGEGKQKKGGSWKKKAVLAGVLGVLAGPVAGQTVEDPTLIVEEVPPTPEQREQIAEKVEQHFEPVPVRPRVLTGTILDEENSPVPGATVFIRGTENGTYTNEEGRFRLVLTDAFRDGPTLTVIVSYVSYSRVSVELHEAEFGVKEALDRTIQLEEQAEIIAFQVGRAPLHRRAWYRTKRLFRWRRR